MKIFIAHAGDAVRSYDVDAVAGTEAAAVGLLENTLVALDRKGQLNTFWSEALKSGWRDDVNVTELELGKAYLDLGQAGEVTS